MKGLAESVSVNCVFDNESKKVFPKVVLWNRRLYRVKQVGLHHTYREGRTLFHVFSVTTGTIFMRLILNTETLFWKLEQISETY